MWPQTAWLPAPAWESPHELWSEECDCGKPNALGQQGWVGVGEGWMAETPAVTSHDTWHSQSPTTHPHSSFATCHLSPLSLPLPTITPHLLQEAFPKVKFQKSCSALLTYRAACWLPRHPGGSSYGRIRPPEVRGTLLATQLTSSCLGSFVLELPMLPKVRQAKLSVVGASSGPGI